MQGLLFPYSRPPSHSYFSYYWGFKNHSCSNSWPRLDFCNSLLAGTSVSNLTRFSVSRILLLELSHKNLGSATLRLFSRICIGFRFATELVSKLPRLLSECSSLSSHTIFHLSSQDMCRREHSALLRLSQYAFLHVKPPWQLPNHFHLLLQVFGIHCQTICLPFQLFLFLEELSNITYSSSLTLTVVQNLAWSKPAQCITLRDTAPTTATAPPGNHAAHLKAFHLSAYDLAEVINFP